jgi:quercetin dioxygenase-like cupin family protein
MDAYALANHEGEATWFLGNRMVLKATKESTGGAYGLVESWVPAGASPPLHVHHREDEAFYVLEGELTIRCGEETFSAPAGSFAFLPCDVPHTFVVEGDRPAHLLTLISPGGGERFFVDAGRTPETEGLPPAGPPDVERLRSFLGTYDHEFVGPPLQPRAKAA